METICYMSRPEWESPELANYILHWQLNMSQMGYLPWGPQQGYWSAYHPQCLPTLPRMPIANIAPSSSATRPFVGVAGGAPKAATGDLLLAASPQTKRLHYTEGGEHRPKRARTYSESAAFHTHPFTKCSRHIHKEDLVRVYRSGDSRRTRRYNVERYMDQYWLDQDSRYEDAINSIRVFDRFTQETSFCSDCHQLFRKPQGYRMHRLMVHHKSILKPMQCLICDHSEYDKKSLVNHFANHTPIDIASEYIPLLCEDEAACLTTFLTENFESQNLCSQDEMEVIGDQDLTKPNISSLDSLRAGLDPLTQMPISPHFAMHLPPTDTPPSSLESSPEDRKLPLMAAAVSKEEAAKKEIETTAPLWEKQFLNFLVIVKSFSSKDSCNLCAKLTNEDKYWHHIFAKHTRDASALHCIFCLENFTVPSHLLEHLESCRAYSDYLLQKYGELSSSVKQAMGQHLLGRCAQLFYPPRVHKSTAWIQKFLSWNEKPLQHLIAVYKEGATQAESIENVKDAVWNYWRDQLDAIDEEIKEMCAHEGIGPRDTFCIDCEKDFDTPAHFRIHRFGVHHPERRPLHCLICVSRFAHVQSLWAHLKAHRPERTAGFFEDHLGKEAAGEVAEICCKRMNIPKRRNSQR